MVKILYILFLTPILIFAQQKADSLSLQTYQQIQVQIIKLESQGYKLKKQLEAIESDLEKLYVLKEDYEKRLSK